MACFAGLWLATTGTGVLVRRWVLCCHINHLSRGLQRPGAATKALPRSSIPALVHTPRQPVPAFPPGRLGVGLASWVRVGQFFVVERCVPPCDQARGRAEAFSRTPGPRFTARSAGERRRQVGRLAGLHTHQSRGPPLRPHDLAHSRPGLLLHPGPCNAPSSNKQSAAAATSAAAAAAEGER